MVKWLLVCALVAVAFGQSADFREAELEAAEGDESLPETAGMQSEVEEQLKVVPNTDEEVEEDDDLEGALPEDEVDPDEELSAEEEEENRADKEVQEDAVATNAQSPVIDLAKAYFQDHDKNTAMTCEAKLLEYKKNLDMMEKTRNTELEKLEVVRQRIKDLLGVQESSLMFLDVSNEQGLHDHLMDDLEAERPHQEVVGPDGINALLKELEDKIIADSKAHKAAYRASVDHCVDACATLLKLRRSQVEIATAHRDKARAWLVKNEKHLEVYQGKLQVAIQEVKREQAVFDKREIMRANELHLIEQLFAKLVELRGLKAVTTSDLSLTLTGDERQKVSTLIPEDHPEQWAEVLTELGREHASANKIAELLKKIKAKLAKEHVEELAELNRLKAIQAALEKKVAYYTEVVKQARVTLHRMEFELRHAHAHHDADRRRCARITTISMGKFLPKAHHRHGCTNVLSNADFVSGLTPWKPNQKVSTIQKGLYRLVYDRQGSSTPGIRQDGIKLEAGAKYRIAISGYVHSHKGHACPWVDNSHGQNILWGCNAEKSLPAKDGQIEATFTALKDPNTLYRIGVLFSGAQKADYFGIRRITMCKVEDAQTVQKRTEHEELVAEIQKAASLAEE